MNCPLILINSGAVANRSWPLTLTEDVAFCVDQYYGRKLAFYSGGKLIATYINGVLTVKAGYALDGYSPVISCPFFCDPEDPWLRLTPTPKCGFAPAILHDITRQFLNVPGCPWDREQTDEWFYNCLIAGGTSKRRAGVYHHAVAGPVGDIYIKATRSVDPRLTIILL